MRWLCPRVAHRATQSLPGVVVEYCNADLDERPDDESHASLSDAVRRHTLPSVNSLEGYTEQYIDEFLGQSPLSGSPPSHALNGLFDRVEDIPTLLVFREKLVSPDIGVVDDVGFIYGS
jgi:hypothetical protein